MDIDLFFETESSIFGHQHLRGCLHIFWYFINASYLLGVSCQFRALSFGRVTAPQLFIMMVTSQNNGAVSRHQVTPIPGLLAHKGSVPTGSQNQFGMDIIKNKSERTRTQVLCFMRYQWHLDTGLLRPSPGEMAQTVS